MGRILPTWRSKTGRRRDGFASGFTYGFLTGQRPNSA